jgi:O-antigen/teichoic acid export membrane protein
MPSRLAALRSRASSRLRTPGAAEVLRKVSGLWVAEGVRLAITAIQGIIVARWLGPHSYGIAALVVGYPGAILQFLDARSFDATVKYLGEFGARGEAKKAASITKLGYAVDTLIALSTSIVVIASAPWAARHIVKAPGTAWMVAAYSTAFVFRFPASTSQAILVSLGRFRAVAVVTIIVTISRAVFLLGLVAVGWGISGVVWGSAIGLVVEGVLFGGLGYPAARRAWGTSGLTTSWQELRGHRREILHFLFWTDLGTLVTSLSKQWDVVVLGYFRHPTEVGYYRLARSVASLAGSVVSGLQLVIYPRFARLGVRDRTRLALAARKSAVWIGVPLGAAAFLSLLILPTVVPLVAGQRFLPAAVAAQLLVAGGGVWITFFWLRPLFLALGEVRFWAVNTGGVSLASFVGFGLLVPTQGFLGMAQIQFAAALLTHGIAGGYLLARGYLRSVSAPCPPSPDVLQDEPKAGDARGRNS